MLKALPPEHPLRGVDEGSTPQTVGSPGRWVFWAMALIVPPCVWPLWVRFVGAGPPAGTFASLILTLLLVTCSVTDLSHHRIPNWATYSGLAWALAINLAVWARVGNSRTPELLGAVGLQDSLEGAAACFGLMYAVYHVAGGGAGDVKLATVIGALLGARLGLFALALTYVVAGVTAFLVAVWVVGPFRLVAGLLRKLGSGLAPGRIVPPDPVQVRILSYPVPLAAFFSAGTVLAIASRETQWLF